MRFGEVRKCPNSKIDNLRKFCGLDKFNQSFKDILLKEDLTEWSRITSNITNSPEALMIEKLFL